MVTGEAALGPFTELSARRLGPVRRFFLRQPVVMDLLVVAWFGVPAVWTGLAAPYVLFAAPSTPGSPTPEWLPLVTASLTLLGAVTLFWRRRRPVLVTATVTFLGAACLLVAGTTNGFELGIALALYAVAASRGALTTWVTSTCAMLVTIAAVWGWQTAVDPAPADGVVTDAVLEQARAASTVFTALFALTAIAIGTAVRNRRLHVAEIVDRANALARDRDQHARLAQAAERTRIAREMHDVVAHNLAVMIALADGAGAALAAAPARARVALAELSETGRSALADMRRVLGVLREPDAPFEPQPDSADLAGLVSRFRAAGLNVATQGLGSELSADAGLRLAVHRIASESLTNALRHAPGTGRVDLVVRRTPTSVEVEVTDDGPVMGERRRAPGGQGIIGMAERAAVYGGTVTAGPVPGGAGWRVHAVLPWSESGDGSAASASHLDGTGSTVPALPAAGAAAPSTAAPLTELTARRLGPVRRYFLRHPVAMDVLVMSLFGLPVIISTVTTATVGTPSADPTTRVVVAGLLVPLLGTALLFWRRRRPVPVAAAMTGLGVLALITTGSSAGTEIGLALALYAVAVAHPPRTAWATLVLSTAALIVAVWIWAEAEIELGAAGDEPQLLASRNVVRVTTATLAALGCLLAVAIGTSVRNRRAHLADLVARTQELARERDRQAQLARSTERARIAREMHDVVAHSISVMIALADGSAASLERAPGRARVAVDELARTGRTALRDMRRVLGVLDTDGPSDADLDEDLPTVVGRFATAGLPVHLTGAELLEPRAGGPGVDDPGLRLAVKRIVSEALTNTLRHAPGVADVGVTLHSQGGMLVVEVVDSGPVVPVADAGGSGQGLIGMRERAELSGGRIEAGPYDGGWRVRAELPWPQQAKSETAETEMDA